MRPLAFLPFTEKQLTLLHRSLYILGLMTIACGLAWSNALMSIGQFILAGNWLLEGKFQEKWEQFTTNRLQQLLLAFMGVVILGFLWTDNLDYAFKDARIKLPLFLMPFIIGSSEKLKRNEWGILLAVYLTTILLLYAASLGKYFGLIGDKEIHDKRELSIFVSHIRYGLNLLLGSALAIYFANDFGKQLSKLAWIIAFLLFTSLIVLELYTALGIGLLLVAVFMYRKLHRSPSQKTKNIGIVTLLALALLGFNSLRNIYKDYHRVPSLQYDQESFQEKTAKGNPYFHNKTDLRKENGIFLWRYIQEDELRLNWNQRSEFDFDGKGNKGNLIFHTLVRYLSSKGLTKDAYGLSQLKEKEIKAIENGISNCYYLDHWPIQNRIYTTLYELDNYSQFGYAEGYSLGMRLEYWKTAVKIIQKNPWVGVGTGDVPQAFELQYYLDKSSLSEKNRRRAHNQFLTMWLTFGIGGLIFFVYFLFKPLKERWKSFYPIFFLISFLSFFTEDTLETQAGVTFFAYFNTLFVLGLDQLKSSK